MMDNSNNDTKNEFVQAVLKKTTFYKIGHHTKKVKLTDCVFLHLGEAPRKWKKSFIKKWNACLTVILEKEAKEEAKYWYFHNKWNHMNIAISEETICGMDFFIRVCLDLTKIRKKSWPFVKWYWNKALRGYIQLDYDRKPKENTN